MKIMDVLKYKQILYYFEKISKIPRKSENETGISNYLLNLAKSENWEAFQDENDSVLIE